MDAALDFPHSPGRVRIRHGHPDDLAPGRLQAEDLAHGGLYILGGSIAHGLDGHGCAAAHGHGTHLNLLTHILAAPFSLVKNKTKKASQSLPPCGKNIHAADCKSIC